MKKIPLKNYFILLIMLFSVVVVTLFGASFYNNNLKKTSSLYKYATHMSKNSLKEYLSESPSLIIYISDKYDLSKEDVEESLKNKIIELNLYSNFVYVDYQEFDEKFLEYFNNTYHTNLNIDFLPTIVIYNDGAVEKIYYSLDIDIIRNLNLDGVKW